MKGIQIVPPLFICILKGVSKSKWGKPKEWFTSCAVWSEKLSFILPKRQGSVTENFFQFFNIFFPPINFFSLSFSLFQFRKYFSAFNFIFPILKNFFKTYALFFGFYNFFQIQMFSLLFQLEKFLSCIAFTLLFAESKKIFKFLFLNPAMAQEKGSYTGGTSGRISPTSNFLV